jgi:hypothetical protein
MEIKHFARKGVHTDTTERFFIHEESKIGNQLNDKNTVSNNKIFEAILNTDSHLTSQPS